MSVRQHGSISDEMCNVTCYLAEAESVSTPPLYSIGALSLFIGSSKYLILAKGKAQDKKLKRRLRQVLTPPYFSTQTKNCENLYVG